MKIAIMSIIILLSLVASITFARRRPRVLPRGRAALRVHDGYNDTEGRYPYVVCLVSETDRICTGTLISSKWVLTAAHCALPYVVAIQYGDMTVSPKQTTNKRKIIKFIQPDNFLDTIDTYKSDFIIYETIQHDIALVRVDEVRMGVYGSISSVDYRTLVGLAVEYAGYGSTGYDRSPVEDILDEKRPLQLGAGVVRACPKKQFNDRSFMCVSQRCNSVQGGMGGDSGGPLVYDGKIVGVFSGIRPLNIYLYNPVSPYLDWIQNIMANYID